MSANADTARIGYTNVLKSELSKNTKQRNETKFDGKEYDPNNLSELAVSAVVSPTKAAHRIKEYAGSFETDKGYLY